MRSLKTITAIGVMILLATGITMGQEQESPEITNKTMRPVVRGQHFAVAAMKAEATRAAERILEKGGNAFDAIVAGQAALGLDECASNCIGDDATMLGFDA